MSLTLFLGPPTSKSPVKDRTNSRILEEGKTTHHIEEKTYGETIRDRQSLKKLDKKSIIAEK